MTKSKDMKFPRMPGKNLGRPNADYESGYGKPPIHSRFAKGQSGNPNGRPKGAKNKIPSPHHNRLREIVMEEAYREISVNDGDRKVTVPMVQAVLRSAAVKAAKGDAKAQRLIIEALVHTEQAGTEDYRETMARVMEYKIHAERTIAECKANGIEPPKFYPHPRDIVIDFDTGNFSIVGPMTAEDAEIWEEGRRYVLEHYANLQRMRREGAEGIHPDVIDELIEHFEMNYGHLLREQKR